MEISPKIKFAFVIFFAILVGLVLVSFFLDPFLEKYRSGGAAAPQFLGPSGSPFIKGPSEPPPEY